MKLIDQPIKINDVEIKNRLVLPPMATGKSDDGLVSDDIINYYYEKTKNGKIGLVYLEHAFISPEGQTSLNMVSVADDECIEGLSKLADVIHANGSKVFLQMNHGGSGAKRSLSGLESIAPSPLCNPCHFSDAEIDSIPPREMTMMDIIRIEKCFADAAERAVKAGFDGVEIHSAHGYLLNQFYSPLTNKRTDEYGGSIDNRIRIHLDVIEAVRKAVGEDFPVSLRFGAHDYLEGGTDIRDAAYAARQFEKAGVDVLSVSGGMCKFERPGHKEEGYFEELSDICKKHVNIPVILTGGFRTGAEIERVLEKGKCDMVGVGRAIMKDSDWALKEL